MLAPLTAGSQVVGAGKHVLGYVVLGTTGLLLLAEKVRVSALLPGNHAVKSVAVSKWYRVPLQVWRVWSVCWGVRRG